MKKVFSLFLSLCFSAAIFAQGDLTGLVTDNEGNVLVNATVILIETEQTTIADLDGRYRFRNIPHGDYRLKISHVGFETQTVRVSHSGSAQPSIGLAEVVLETGEALILANRASTNTPTTYTIVDAEELGKRNLGVDLPVLLKFTPSIVTTTDAGNGVGYTGLRLRGSDASRINVTINGVPLNDSESQGVFWVNLPDLATSVNDIQIQRGVGTSTNGAGAFGGSINVKTTDKKAEAYGLISNSLGSYNTRKHTLAFGTGLIKDHFTVDARLSRLYSDGYIDRATSDLLSAYVSAGYYDENTILKANVIIGKEVTYQAWNGVPEDSLENNRTYNISGTDFWSKSGDPYDNEVDDYRQDHYQFLLNQQINSNWLLNTGVHYTHGRGFFEQYKVGESFGSYGFDNIILPNDTITSTDLVRRRWLDNDFYGLMASIKYANHEDLEVTFGGAWNQYDGDHFGEIIWSEFGTAEMFENNYYSSNGLKTDFNFFAKFEYQMVPDWLLYADFQFRNVGYAVHGIDSDLRPIFVDDHLSFYNPKFGLTYFLNEKSQMYGSFAIANKEPSRNDYIDAPNGNAPLPESLRDVELGYRYHADKVMFSANGYYMNYRNQLVLTGALNDVGTPIRTNVDNSYRTGIELDGAFHILDEVSLMANVTLSQNKIREFTEVVNTFDDNYVPVDSLQINNELEDVDISYSPNIIGSFAIEIRPVEGLSVTFYNKYVGPQFLDNTQSDNKKIDGYYVTDAGISYTIPTENKTDIRFDLLLNNITNTLYSSNGYTFSERYVSGGAVTDVFAYNYFYPQAPFNFMAGLTIGF